MPNLVAADSWGVMKIRRIADLLTAADPQAPYAGPLRNYSIGSVL